MATNKLHNDSTNAKKKLQALYLMCLARVAKATLAVTEQPSTRGVYQEVLAAMENTTVGFHSEGNNKRTDTAVKIRKSGLETNVAFGDSSAADVSFNRSVPANETASEFVGRTMSTVVVSFQTEIAADSKALVKAITSPGAGGFPREATAKFDGLMSQHGVTVSNAERRGATRCELVNADDFAKEIALADEIIALERGFRGLDENGVELTQADSRDEQDAQASEEIATADLNKQERQEMKDAGLVLVCGMYLPKAIASVIKASIEAMREAYIAETGSPASKEQGRRIAGEVFLEWHAAGVNNAVRIAADKTPKKGKKSA